MVDKRKTSDKMGRPRHEFTADVIPILEGVPDPGTVTQMCEALGIGSHVFYKWLGEEKEFSEAVLRVRARADDQIENAFFNRAKGYTTTVIEEKLDKDGISHALSKDIHMAAEPGAALNWLKNRRPDEWRDKKVVEVEGSHVDLVTKAVQELGIDLDD